MPDASTMDPAAVLQRLQEIESREQAATQGPWAFDTDWCDCGDGYGCSHGEFPYAVNVPSMQVAWGFAKNKPDASKHAAEIVDEFGENATLADGEFIAHSREDVKWLCAALRTALADTRRVDWQPIETAPKNGHHILIWSDDYQIRVAHWLHGWCYTSHTGASIPIHKPIQWMPLPVPPDIDDAMAATPRDA